MTDLDDLARTTARLHALAELHADMIATAMTERHHTVTDIAKAAGMTRAGVHKLVARRTIRDNSRPM